MDGMFDIFGYGMINPRDRDKDKRGIFWKDKTNTGIDFTSIGNWSFRSKGQTNIT